MIGGLEHLVTDAQERTTATLTSIRSGQTDIASRLAALEERVVELQRAFDERRLTKAEKRHLKTAVQNATTSTGFPHVAASGAQWLAAALDVLRPHLTQSAPNVDKPSATEHRVLTADDGEAALRKVLNEQWSAVSSSTKTAIHAAWKAEGGTAALAQATAGDLPSKAALNTKDQAKVLAAWLPGVTQFPHDVTAAYRAFGVATPGTLADTIFLRYSIAAAHRDEECVQRPLATAVISALTKELAKPDSGVITVETESPATGYGSGSDNDVSERGEQTPATPEIGSAKDRGQSARVNKMRALRRRMLARQEQKTNNQSTMAEGTDRAATNVTPGQARGGKGKGKGKGKGQGKRKGNERPGKENAPRPRKRRRQRLADAFSPDESSTTTQRATKRTNTALSDAEQSSDDEQADARLA